MESETGTQPGNGAFGPNSTAPKKLAESKPSLQDLPPETKLKILSYVPCRELSSSVVRVNREWSRLAMDPSLWWSIDAIVPRDDVSCLWRFLARFHEARRIRIRADGGKFKELIREWDLSEHEELKNLQIFAHAMHEFSELSHVFECVSVCKQLRSLALQNVSLQQLPISELRFCLLNNLTELRLRGCECDGDHFVEGVVKACPHLQLLDLRISPYVSHRDMVLIADSLPVLRALFVNMDDASGASCQYLARKCKKLEAFFMLAAVSETSLLALFAMPTLKFLHVDDLSAGRCSNVSIAMCLKISSGFGSLRAVSFTGLGILSAETFADFDFVCPELQWLSVQSEHVTDSGLAALIRSCPNLKVLCVRDSLRVTGQPWLQTVGDVLPQLRTLRLICPELDTDLLKASALKYPKIFMSGDDSGEVEPPNDVKYPFLRLNTKYSFLDFERESDFCHYYCSPISLVALDGRGIPYADEFRSALRPEEEVQFS